MLESIWWTPAFGRATDQFAFYTSTTAVSWYGPSWFHRYLAWPNVISQLLLPHGHGGQTECGRRNHGHACLPVLIRTGSGRIQEDYFGIVPGTTCPAPLAEAILCHVCAFTVWYRVTGLFSCHTRPPFSETPPGPPSPPPLLPASFAVQIGGGRRQPFPLGHLGELPAGRTPTIHLRRDRQTQERWPDNMDIGGEAEHQGSPTSTTVGWRGSGTDGKTSVGRVKFTGRSCSLHRSNPRQHALSSPACHPRAASGV